MIKHLRLLKQTKTMVVTFPPVASQTILDILIDLRDNKPYRVISRIYDVSVHYVKKMNRYFGECNSSDEISAIRRRINIENHRVKTVSIDPQVNYKKYKAYYIRYGRARNVRLRDERIERRRIAREQLEQEARDLEDIDEIESIVADDFEFIPHGDDFDDFDEILNSPIVYEENSGSSSDESTENESHLCMDASEPAKDLCFPFGKDAIISSREDNIESSANITLIDITNQITHRLIPPPPPLEAMPPRMVKISA